jgi:hypothetical protein
MSIPTPHAQDPAPIVSQQRTPISHSLVRQCYTKIDKLLGSLCQLGMLQRPDAEIAARLWRILQSADAPGSNWEQKANNLNQDLLRILTQAKREGIKALLDNVRCHFARHREPKAVKEIFLARQLVDACALIELIISDDAAKVENEKTENILLQEDASSKDGLRDFYKPYIKIVNKPSGLTVADCTVETAFTLYHRINKTFDLVRGAEMDMWKRTLLGKQTASDPTFLESLSERFKGVSSELKGDKATLYDAIHEDNIKWYILMGHRDVCGKNDILLKNKDPYWGARRDVSDKLLPYFKSCTFIILEELGNLSSELSDNNIRFALDVSARSTMAIYYFSAEVI